MGPGSGWLCKCTQCWLLMDCWMLRLPPAVLHLLPALTPRRTSLLNPPRAPSFYSSQGVQT